LTFDGTNLGVGTTSPARKLDIYDATAPTFSLHNSTSGTGSSDGFLLFTLGSDVTLQNYESGYMAFGTAATERMRIDSSGNVGIGTPAPAGRLHIYGDTYVNSQLRVQRNGVVSGTWSIGCATTNNTLIFQDEVAAATRMSINSTGIVTMSAYGVGTATFSASGVISSVSDETWKIKNGVPVDPDAMLKKLEPGYWYYNDEKKEIFGVDRQLGFYAQNVNAAIGPEAAPTPEEGKPWGYYDRSVLAVTVMSLQKALATIESLTARITALESKG
jgi:hypothetical protein